MPDNTNQPVYIVTCIYGLESPLAAEVRERLEVEADRHWCEAIFPFAGSPARLKELRVAGNVFVRLDHFHIGPAAASLEELSAHLKELPVDAWQARWEEFSGRRLTDQDIAIAVKRAGEHKYTYQDVEELALDVLPQATGRRATLTAHPLELRIDINDDVCRLAGRLTDAPLSDRPYKRRHAVGETDPTVAAAMIRWSKPQPDDVFLDPMCGTGTIAIERALTGPAARILAGDIKEKKLPWAAENAGLAGGAAANITFNCWDAFSLPLEDQACTRIVTSPPQSEPNSGKPWKLEEFAGLVNESVRVLRFGGRMVWLLLHGRQMDDVLKRFGHVRVQRRFRCGWKGKSWMIYVIEKVL